jgi:hypothetical protein
LNNASGLTSKKTKRSGPRAASTITARPQEEPEAKRGRQGYRQRANGDLERMEGSLVYVIIPQQGKQSLTGE